MRKINKYKWNRWLAVFMVGLALASCTKYNNPAPEFEEYEQDVDSNQVKRKILFISIDGLVGSELENNIPEHLGKLMENGKYSFVSLGDMNTSDPSSWATMMTGVNSNKHKITTDSYIPTPDPNHPHDSEDFYPSLFFRISEQNPYLSSAVITRTSAMNNILLMDADEAQALDSDEKVKSSVVEELKNANADLLVAQFTSVQEAGTQTQFSFDSPEYKNATLKVDGYVGEIMTALESRSSYDKEEWLVIVTSNHGGLGNSYGGSSLEERNTFAIYHYKKFQKQELKAETLMAPRFYGYDNAGVTAMRARNTTVSPQEVNYNIARTGELTVEAKVKINKKADGSYSYSWPPFLSKVNARSGSTAGWSFFRSGNNVSFFVADGSAKIEIGAGAVGVDEVWTHITGTFSRINGIPTAKFYINGRLATSGELATLNVNNVLSTSPLTFGFQPEVFSDQYLDFYMADVHIWNVALTDEEILQNANRVGLEDNHPKKQFLVGYWPLDKVEENVFKNKVSGQPDMPILGKASFNIFGNNLPYVDPEKAILIKSEDITMQMLYWFNINVRDSWGLEGQNFLKNFELEFLQ
ncbi:LamG-like jellyroll fold domain-containing protein [Sphingobacterium sp. SYP-B4668]|uniref:LamG-like jellyroll fold domain-containing protein n=1 Tax=Sphingobacterium sp. SYP-B4668 TaxID=2996035 RepID=UPI0022DDE736|nr:LamG-like jellyroll fold domain-containing protein [Sphingobacterium sp. SYP-B4668]